MKENDIQKVFDKITLSEGKKNLIANSIIQKREVRTGKKVNYTVWRQVLQVCLLIVLSVMVVIVPMLIKPTQSNTGLNGLAEGSSTDSEAVSDDTSADTSDTSSEVSEPDIPDDITYEYIIGKMTDDNIYYDTISGTLMSYYPKSIPIQSSTIVFQHDNRTSGYYEYYKSNLGADQETYCDGTKTVFYNNERKVFSVYNYPLTNIKDLSEIALYSNAGSLAGLTWLKAPKSLKEAYGNFNHEITMTKYLDRDCAVLTRSVKWLDPNSNPDEELKYQNMTVYEYVDVLTGVILCYECKNEAGEVAESVKFTDVKFNEDLKVKSIAEAGTKYDDYFELMALKIEKNNITTATQTIGNLQITMEFNKYYILKGDKVVVKTTVRNVGSEPITLYAPSNADGIQGSASLSTYYKGEAYNFGLVKEEVDKSNEIYTGELQPGESFTREDVFDTNQAEDIELKENMELYAFIEVRANVNILDGEEFKSEIVTAEVQYRPFSV